MNVIKVYKRGIWREREFLYLIPSTMFFLFVLIKYIKYPEFHETKVNFGTILLLIAGTAFISLLICNIKSTIRKNKVIVNGDIIRARIDRRRSSNSDIKEEIYCGYYDCEKGEYWEFKAKYTEDNLFMFGGKELEKETFIPVIVDSNNPKNYVVLIDELIYSYRKGISKPVHFTKLLRTVDMVQLQKQNKIKAEKKK